MKDIKLFVELPEFLGFSHGTLCLRDLIESFEKNNIKVIKILRSNSLKNKIKQKLYISSNKSIVKNFKENCQKGDCFLACDTSSPYLLDIARKNNLRIIWWQLAPYNFLGNNQIPKPGEFSLPFSSFTDPFSEDYFYFQAKLDSQWENAIQKMKERGKKKYHKICIYNGKGRLCSLDREIKSLFPDYDIEIITRLRPKIRSEYFKLLYNSDGLISFDHITQANLEAASLGLPVYIANPLFPKKCLEKFNIKELKYRITSSSKEFIKNVKSDKNPNFPLEKSYLESYNNTTIKNFIEIIKGTQELNPLREKDINNFKKYTRDLHSKKVIFPYINSGQSPSSLLIKRYKKILIDNKNTFFLNLLMSALDFLGYWLFKLGLIRIIEVFVVKLVRFLRK